METYSFDVGTFRCTAINDGIARYWAEDYVVNAPPDDVAAALAVHGHAPDAIPSPYSGLVVDTGDTRVLIDTGAGDLTPDVGRLHENLRAAGIGPDSIDTVVITHAHPDHIGGNVAENGERALPRARYVIDEREWRFWTDETELAKLAGVFGEWSRKHLQPLADYIDPVHDDVEIVDGIEVITTPGHTPGHLGVAIRSGGSELLYVSDAALHPIHLEHPTWRPVWDQDPDAALASRRRLFDQAVTDGALVLAFHFPPFPSLGNVWKRGNGWHWEALPAASDAA